MGYNYYRLKNLAVGSLLHDIGKQLVPIDIINKNGRLTDAEMDVVREHPNYGYKILSKDINTYSATREIVHQHHENWDGSGYPRGLKENEIYVSAKTNENIFNKKNIFDLRICFNYLPSIYHGHPSLKDRSCSCFYSL